MKLGLQIFNSLPCLYLISNTYFKNITSFFRYADHPNAYWTGYFTSRPAFKGYVRMMSSYYLVRDCKVGYVLVC